MSEKYQKVSEITRGRKTWTFFGQLLPTWSLLWFGNPIQRMPVATLAKQHPNLILHFFWPSLFPKHIAVKARRHQRGTEEREQVQSRAHTYAGSCRHTI